MRRTLVILAAALAIASIPTAAFARTKRAPGFACVDVGNDGHCDANDPALAPLIADGNFNASVAEPGWSPVRTPVGVVFDGYTLAQATKIVVTGDVHFADKVQTQHWGLGLDVTANTVDVAPNAVVVIATDFKVTAARFHVGARAELETPGKDVPGMAISAGTVQLDTNARLSAAGMYSALSLDATNMLTLGQGVSFATAPRGEFDLHAGSDIVADGLRIRAGLITVSSTWKTAGEHRVISLTNSTVENTYTNSWVTMYAGAQASHQHSPQDAIHFVHSNVSSHAQGNTYFDPPPS